MGNQGGTYLPRDHYAVLVVGSGFGGAVAACRLAQAGVDVAVVERGRRWPPGTFPRRIGRLGSGWWWLHRHGLYDVGPFGAMLCVRASGWGGGSLLYANVAMRPGPEVFEESWPQPYRRATLDPYFDLAAHMLEVTPVQADPHTGELPAKTLVMAEAGERLGDRTPLFHPNLAVRFAEDPDHPGVNRFGVAQSPCIGCAQCDIGCNVGAKNTLDLNYLALAERHGATVATLTRVTHLAREGDGYRVFLHQHGDADVENRSVTADRVVLGAGALGSTEILLRSRDRYATLPDLPAALGRGYSGNGDFLAFGDGTADLVSPGTGPTITTAYGLRTAEGDRFYVEDGGYPNEIAGLVPGAGGIGRRPTGHDSVLLVMGRDRADGRIRLTRRGRLHVDWDVAANRSLYDAEERAARDVVAALGGRGSTFWPWRWFRRPVSVHHLGGCPMSEGPATGVVDTTGQVHGHPGLYVVDGAVLPAATGANPSHTITAVAEYCVERLVRDLTGDPGWRAPEWGSVVPVPVPEDHAPSAELPDVERQPGLTFHEVMSGSLAVAGAEVPVSVDLSVEARDLTAFVRDPRHRMLVLGRVVAPPLTAQRGAPVDHGTLDLLALTGEGRRRTMAYVLPFWDADGRRRELRGQKDVWAAPGRGLWRATTRLGMRVDENPGTLRLSVLGVARGALSIRPVRAPSSLAAAGQVTRFLGFFAGSLADTFLPRPFGRR